MGGDISVKSEYGKGSTFTLTIKPGIDSQVELVRPSSIDGSRRVVAQTISLPACRILVVDDEAANRRLATIYISRAGGTVDVATNGAEAVQMATSTSYDAILMDMQMPVMDGLEATRRLRADGFTLPIFALTANILEEGREAADEAGCTGFLTKPIHQSHLLKTLLESVENAPQRPSVSQPDDCELELPSADTGCVSDTVVDEPSIVDEPAVANEPSIDDSPIESTLPTEDPEFQAIVASFVERLRQRVAALGSALDAQKFDVIADEAHWMAGAAGTVGFAVLTDSARELERAAKARSTSDLTLCLIEIEGLVSRFVIPEPVLS